MKSVVSVSPFHCRMWALHDRLEGQITEETCKAEIESFSKHGQLVPVLGRALQGDLEHKFELIYGARRLFVARYINQPLLVEVRDMTDREAVIAMDIENRQRADISAYERGLSYARLLRSGHFATQDDIAKTLKVSASQVSRYLKLAQLPSVILNAFQSPGAIYEGWGIDLANILEDSRRRQATIQRAHAICRVTPRPPARDVYRQLVGASAGGRKVVAVRHDEVVKDERGSPLFRISVRSNTIAILLPLNALSKGSLGKLRVALKDVLNQQDGADPKC